MNLEKHWEIHRDHFHEINIEKFDELARNKEFKEGPLIENPSKWMDRYGPYNPERHVFGQLKNGQFLCAIRKYEECG